jgi:hypothetical protein
MYITYSIKPFSLTVLRVILATKGDWADFLRFLFSVLIIVINVVRFHNNYELSLWAALRFSSSRPALVCHVTITYIRVNFEIPDPGSLATK